MKTFAKKICGLAGTLLVAAAASGQTYSIDSFTIAGGSGTVSGGDYSVSGTIGQPDASLELSGGDFSMAGGFWSNMLIPGTPLPPELRITAAETIGNDLRLSFTAVAGQKYAIQSRADLSSGTWTTLPGTTNSGTDGTLQITLSNALAQSQQFYRVQVVP